MTVLAASDSAFWLEVKASLEVIFGGPNPPGEEHTQRLLHANRELQQLALGQGIDADGWSIQDRFTPLPKGNNIVVSSPDGALFEFIEGVGLRELA